MVAIRSAPMPCGHEADAVVGLRVGGPCAAVGAHRHAAHRLDAAGEHQIVPAGAHLLRGGVDGLQAGCAEAVELEAAGGLGQLGHQRGGAGDVAALIADGRHDAEDEVADQVLVQVGKAGAQFVDQADDQVDGLDLVEGAVLVLAARRANGLVDEGFFRHEEVPVQVGLFGRPAHMGGCPLRASLTAPPNRVVGRFVTLPVLQRSAA